MARVLVVHGPNLDLLGQREPELYGKMTLDQVNEGLVRVGKSLGVEILTYQSNHEGDLIDFIHAEGADCLGLIINAGALSHYSYALRDAITATGVRAIEVHITNVYAREEFRRHSVIAPVCVGQISGLGARGYLAALRWLAEPVK